MHATTQTALVHDDPHGYDFESTAVAKTKSAQPLRLALRQVADQRPVASSQPARCAVDPPAQPLRRGEPVPETGDICREVMQMLENTLLLLEPSDSRRCTQLH